MIVAVVIVAVAILAIALAVLTAFTMPPDPPLDQDDLEGWM